MCRFQRLPTSIYGATQPHVVQRPSVLVQPSRPLGNTQPTVRGYKIQAPNSLMNQPHILTPSGRLPIMIRTVVSSQATQQLAVVPEKPYNSNGPPLLRSNHPKVANPILPMAPNILKPKKNAPQVHVKSESIGRFQWKL